MTTTTTYQSSSFSLTAITPRTDGLDCDAVAEAIVDRFHELAQAGDPSVDWRPETSEVYYDVRGEGPSPLAPVHAALDFEAILARATEEIWARVSDGEFAQAPVDA